MKKLIVVLLVALVAIQFIPVERSNPAVAGPPPLPADVLAVVRESCFDCHSHETAWPWYARVAPVSWLLARDVEEGREHLNFSRWDEYTPEEQAKARHEVWEEVEADNMPLWFYVPLHPEAKLTDEDRQVLQGWASREDPKEDS